MDRDRESTTATSAFLDTTISIELMWSPEAVGPKDNVTLNLPPQSNDKMHPVLLKIKRSVLIQFLVVEDAVYLLDLFVSRGSVKRLA